MELLRNLQHERTVSNNRSDQHVNSNCRCPTVSHSQIDETPMRMTRKRGRSLEKSDPISPAVSHVHLSRDSRRREHPIDLSKNRVLSDCCQTVVVNGGPCKCIFQGLLEYLIGMKLSAADRPEGKCLNTLHPPSGYSFSLTWINNPALSEVELLYNVISLGYFCYGGTRMDEGGHNVQH